MKQEDALHVLLKLCNDMTCTNFKSIDEDKESAIKIFNYLLKTNYDIYTINENGEEELLEDLREWIVFDGEDFYIYTHSWGVKLYFKDYKTKWICKHKRERK